MKQTRRHRESVSGGDNVTAVDPKDDVVQRLDSIDQRQNELRTSLKELQGELAKLEHERQLLFKRLEFLHIEPTASDHSVLRFLERCKGIDVEAARAELLELLHENIMQFGSGKFPLGDGMMAVVKQKRVVTVAPK